MFAPGQQYYTTFTTQKVDTGMSVNADYLPVATAIHNGVSDPNFALTVTNQSLGLYMVSGTIPNTYVRGDAVQIYVWASVGGVVGKSVVSDFVVGGAPTFGQVYP